MTIKLIIFCCLLGIMIVLKESTDYLESKKASLGSEINDLNNKISSSQKRLDELRREKYNIDFQSDETNKRVNSIKKIWIASSIFIVSAILFTYSINIFIPILLSVFGTSIAVLRSKSLFNDLDTYNKLNSASLEKEIKIKEISKDIRQNYEALKVLNKKYEDYEKGLIGERSVTESLKNLNIDSYLINDITLDRRFGNIDHILVSMYGIFIIETKNWQGEIVCNGDSWSKHFANETTYNPVDFDIMSLSKRVKGNAKKLSLLIENNIFNNLMNVWVDGIIVFTNPNAKLRLINPSVPVLTVRELTGYIERQQPKNRFSSKDVESIANLINIHSRA